MIREALRGRAGRLIAAARGWAGQLLPATCPGCGAVVADGGALCAACWSALAFLVPPLCARCALPLPQTAGDAAAAPVCAGCRADPPPFARAHAAVRYDDASRALVLRLKHGDGSELAPVLAGLMLQARAGDGPPPDVVAAVPLHPLRRIRRRYNQAGLVAAAIAQRLRRPYLPLVVRRRRATRSQGGLSASQRRRNVAGAFDADRALLAGRRVLLVDDVMTTGATLRAAARACLKAGAAEVEVLVFARALPPGTGGTVRG
ncbi:MAG: phosphoribosyltransferase [Rhodothalassiaceae bacterium]|nr:MAG: phosphoribosyltransferase [Rhodothalassiaceae bacterium]